MALLRILQKCPNIAKNSVAFGQRLCLRQSELSGKVFQRRMGSHSFPPVNSFDLSFNSRKLYDDLFYYLTLHAIPAVLFVTIMNMRHGKPELIDVPEDYEPKHWEYFEHPITRLMAKHFHDPPEMIYESTMQSYVRTRELAKIRLIQQKMNRLNALHQDFATWYYYDRTMEDYNQTHKRPE